MKEIARQISLRRGPEALEFVQAVASMTNSLFDSLPGILEKAGIDALVLDTYHFYMELVPIRLGMSYAHLSNALHFDYSGRRAELCSWSAMSATCDRVVTTQSPLLKAASSRSSAWIEGSRTVPLADQAGFGAAPGRPKLIRFDDVRRASRVSRPSPTPFRGVDLDLQTK
jgi:hypothetical protein